MYRNICINCNKKWESSHPGKFCSSTCNHINAYAISRANIDFIKNCIECKSVFIAKRISARYCSSKCNNLALYKVRDIEKTNARKLELNKGTKARKRVLDRYRNNINFKLTCVLRARLNQAMRRSFISGSAVKDLGCSISELKAHLESKFQPGMTWENWSRHGWHIDHIIPLSKFILQNEEHLKKACNYTNLQPLWAHDNLSKGAK